MPRVRVPSLTLSKEAGALQNEGHRPLCCVAQPHRDLERLPGDLLRGQAAPPIRSEGGRDDYRERDLRRLALFEKHLGLSLPQTVFTDRLPVYAVRGAPADDVEEISDWAEADGRPVPDRRPGLIPAGPRRDYERATAPVMFFAVLQEGRWPPGPA
ncbi:hypothetical protein SHKM778_81530 [Streptomyces sp. KM77-8]|uniref:Uncharacterized protein n=1 Tax=Streptomyces haneummycinicus TaxID=3074435 RepID=A0AAT9HWL0_9ACTN